jgi:hypothetical protein
MPPWVVNVPVAVEAATPDEAVTWVKAELAEKPEPDKGTGSYCSTSVRSAAQRTGDRG